LLFDDNPSAPTPHLLTSELTPRLVGTYCTSQRPLNGVEWCGEMRVMESFDLDFDLEHLSRRNVDVQMCVYVRVFERICQGEKSSINIDLIVLPFFKWLLIALITS